MTKTANSLSIVTACRNREHNLKLAIKSWLALEPAEIIICDWGSSTPIDSDILEVYDVGVKVTVIRKEADNWILTWAFNEALSQVNTDYVLKLDCDHVVSKDFLEKNIPVKNCFMRGHWRNVEKGQEYINGAFLSCTALLRAVGYYDERITTYGWDDSDLYERLYDSCLKSSVFAKGTVAHLEQCVTTRTKEQQVSTEAALASKLGIEKTAFLINRNRFLVGMLWPWNKNMYENRHKIRINFAKMSPKEASFIEYATQKAFELHYEWSNLYAKTGIPSGEAYLQALYAHDQNPENMPSSISIATLLGRYSDAIGSNDLLEKNFVRMALLANAEQTRLESRLAALERIDNIKINEQNKSSLSKIHTKKSKKVSPVVFSTKPKFFIDAQHGLGNRLRAIGSAAAIADHQGYELVIVWEPDEHCNCYFHDLFDYSGAVIDSSFKTINEDNMSVYNYMEIEGGQKNVPIQLLERKMLTQDQPSP